VVEGTPFGRYQLLSLLGRDGIGGCGGLTTRRATGRWRSRCFPPRWPTTRQSCTASAAMVQIPYVEDPTSGADKS
jgi:hypothetical protein